MKSHFLFFLGLSNRLKAFEKFLELHPGYIEKIMLLQVAVPSRTDVQEYIGKIYIDNFGIEIIMFWFNTIQNLSINNSIYYIFSDLKDEMDQLVGQINGRFSTPRWSPIRYIFGCINQVKTNLLR